MLPSNMNSTDQRELHANTNETADEVIYTTVKTIRAQTDGNDRKKQEGKLPGAETTEVKYYRVAVVSLGLLCALLLVVIIWMVTKYTAERDQQKMNMDQLQLRNTNLTQKRNQLQKNMDQLQLTNNNLTQERDHFQARNTNLTTEKNNLMAKNIILITAEKEMLQKACGWNCSDSSCYYISTNQKTWNDSKQHCMDLGGHLVIIDSEEEQKFVSLIKKKVWIGAMKTEGTWKWVDGKVLGNAGYWAEEEPNNLGGEEDCVEIQFRGGPLRNWNDINCSLEKIYICEKAM